MPAALRLKRVRFSIFLCFFLRMRLRRFLINEPMRLATLSVTPWSTPTPAYRPVGRRYEAPAGSGAVVILAETCAGVPGAYPEATDRG